MPGSTAYLVENNLMELLHKLDEDKLQDYTVLEKAIDETPDRSLEEDEKSTISNAIFSLGYYKNPNHEILAKKLISKINPDLFTDEHVFEMFHIISNSRLSIENLLIPLVNAGFRTDVEDKHGRTPQSLFREQIKADKSPPEEDSIDYQILEILENGSKSRYIKDNQSRPPSSPRMPSAKRGFCAPVCTIS